MCSYDLAFGRREPPHRLEGFRKVFLEPGESRTVTVPLDARAFSYWVLRAGYGDSSRSLRLSGSVATGGGSRAARGNG